MEALLAALLAAGVGLGSVAVRNAFLGR